MAKLVMMIFFMIWSAVNGVLHDLTYPMNNITLSWGGKPFVLNVTKKDVLEVGYSFYYQADEINTPTHVGTHLDAPCHFAKGRWCVSEIPIQRLYSRPGYIIDISSKCASNRDYMLSVSDLESWLETNAPIQDGAVLLIKTGWSKYWPDRGEYFGYDSQNNKHFPGISPAAAKYIASEKRLNIYGVGIEGPSVDAGQNKDRQTHVTLGRKDIYNLENVASLQGLPERGFLITSLPIKIDGSSGSPVRIIAQIPFNSANILDSKFVLIIVCISSLLQNVVFW